MVQACLSAVGELSLVSHSAVRPYLHVILPEVIRALQDQTVLQKTEIAMRALGQIVSSTGDVVTPYLEYPELLDAVLDALKVSVSAGSGGGGGGGGGDADEDDTSGGYR